MISYVSVNKINDLELGMSKAEVTKILGKHDRTPVMLDRAENGIVYETISYVLSGPTIYYIDFENDKMVRWYKQSDHPYAYPVPPPPVNSYNVPD